MSCLLSVNIGATFLDFSYLRSVAEIEFDSGARMSSRDQKDSVLAPLQVRRVESQWWIPQRLPVSILSKLEYITAK